MVKKIRKLTPAQFKELENRMRNYEFAKIDCHFGMARRTAKGIVTFTRGTTKEAAVARWYSIAMKELNKKERAYKSSE